MLNPNNIAPTERPQWFLILSRAEHETQNRIDDAIFRDTPHDTETQLLEFIQRNQRILAGSPN